MPTFRVSIQKIGGGIYDVVGGKQVAMSPRASRAINDYSSAWLKSAPAMTQNTIDVWANGQSEWDGYKSKSYPNWKANEGYSSDKNTMTGNMKWAMGYGQINDMQPMEWTWGIDASDDMWQKSSKSMTAYPEVANKIRPFMVMTKKLINSITLNVKNYMLKAFKGQ